MSCALDAAVAGCGDDDGGCCSIVAAGGSDAGAGAVVVVVAVVPTGTIVAECGWQSARRSARAPATICASSMEAVFPLRFIVKLVS